MNVQRVRIVLWLIAAGVSIAVIGSGVWFLSVADAAPQGDSSAQPAASWRRAASLSLIVLATFLLFLLFLIGSYLIVRAGRVFRQPRETSEPTAYVDAWASAAERLTDEDVSRATGEPEPPGPSLDEH